MPLLARAAPARVAVVFLALAMVKKAWRATSPPLGSTAAPLSLARALVRGRVRVRVRVGPITQNLTLTLTTLALAHTPSVALTLTTLALE